MDFSPISSQSSVDKKEHKILSWLRVGGRWRGSAASGNNISLRLLPLESTSPLSCLRGRGSLHLGLFGCWGWRSSSSLNAGASDGDDVQNRLEADKKLHSQMIHSGTAHRLKGKSHFNHAALWVVTLACTEFIPLLLWDVYILGSSQHNLGI